MIHTAPPNVRLTSHIFTEVYDLRDVRKRYHNWLKQKASRCIKCWQTNSEDFAFEFPQHPKDSQRVDSNIETFTMGWSILAFEKGSVQPSDATVESSMAPDPGPVLFQHHLLRARIGINAVLSETPQGKRFWDFDTF